MKERVTITIKKSLWKILSQLKLDKGFKSFEEVIESLLGKKKQ